MAGDRQMSEANGTHMNNLSIGPQTTNKGIQINEALQMQIKVQRRLHQQLEVQRHLQLRIEAQGKYLQAVLEKAQETLGRQNLGTVGQLEAAKVQLSELVSKVSNQCFNSAFSDLRELQQQGLCPLPQATPPPPPPPNDDSCLTSCEVSHREQEIHNNNNNNGICLRTYNNSFLQDTGIIAKDLSMSVGLQGSDKGINGSNNKRAETVSNRLAYFATKLDLNVHEENDAASNCKQFDLNGLSWS